VIRTFIVDDEPLAREAIRLRLNGEPDIEIVGEAGDGLDAVRQMTRLRPDLVFIDIHMREMSGFEVVERVAETHLPIVIFVTAYDQYALRAFEAHALDYLLKPFTSNRFAAALYRARLEVAKAADRDSQIRLLSLLTERLRLRDHGPGSGSDAPAYLSRLTVKHNSRIALIKTDDIDWIESSANYANLHVGSATSFVVRMTMLELERRLDPARFARIHRSSIVQIDRIKDIAPAFHGDFSLTLRNGTTLRLTRNYRERLFGPRGTGPNSPLSP
jgi:two-component system LytT family response regulator